MPSNKMWMPLLVIAAVALVGLVAYQQFGAQQTAIPPADTGAASVNSNVGSAASLRILAMDYGDKDAAPTQVASTAYVEQTNGQHNLIANGQSLSASARTSVASTVGVKFRAASFDSTYYGDIKEGTVEYENTNLDLVNYAIGNVTADVYDFGGKLASNARNLTLGAGQTDSFDKIYLQEDTANKVFRLKMICMDVPANSNISDVSINEMTEVSVPSRLRRGSNNYDYCFQLGSYKQLDEFADWSSGAVSFTADGSNNPGVESVSVAIIDESLFIGKDQTIKSGVENEASPPANVGQTDTTFTVNIL